MRILGIDPGSRLTGFGCIEVVAGAQLKLITQGVIRAEPINGPLDQRLLFIFNAIQDVIREHRPQVLVLEKVFFAKNAVSSLKLGQARGVALLCGAAHGLESVEYNPTEVKKAISGFGHADKAQVAHMVELMVGKQEFKTADASDAVALAICHARGVVPSRRSKRTSLADALKHRIDGVSKD